jgi:hypothetical protein
MKRPNRRKNFCDLCWTFWSYDVCNGAVVHSAKVIGQPDNEPVVCRDCKDAQAAQYDRIASEDLHIDRDALDTAIRNLNA